MPRYAKLPQLDPARLDLDIYRGDTFSVRAQLYAHARYIKLDGWSFEAQIRGTINGEVITEFLVDVFAPKVGEIRLLLDDSRTAVLPDECVWDLESTDPYGRVRTLLYGVITVDRDITRDDTIRRTVRAKR